MVVVLVDAVVAAADARVEDAADSTMLAVVADTAELECEDSAVKDSDVVV